MKNKGLFLTLALALVIVSCGSIPPLEKRQVLTATLLTPTTNATKIPTRIGTAAPLPTGTPEIGRIVGSWNLRSCPSTSCPSIAVLENVDVRILEKRKTGADCDVWVRVEYDHQFGWMCSEGIE